MCSAKHAHTCPHVCVTHACEHEHPLSGVAWFWAAGVWLDRRRPSLSSWLNPYPRLNQHIQEGRCYNLKPPMKPTHPPACCTCSYFYISILYNVCYTLALYGLLLFWIGAAELLEPFNPLLKFILVKTVVFLTFWQARELQSHFGALHFGVLHMA